MRLVDLDPRWWAEPGRVGQGVAFLCPCCRREYLSVAFSNPLDGGAPFNVKKIGMWSDATYSTEPHAARIKPGTIVVPPGVNWLREGDTFETLGVLPSVDASRAGHWHGWLRAGEAHTC